MSAGTRTPDAAASRHYHLFVKTRELENLGIPRGRALEAAKVLCVRASEQGLKRDGIRAMIEGVMA